MTFLNRSRMRRFALLSVVVASTWATLASAQIGPSTAPATRPAPAVVPVETPLGAITPATGPVAVPYTLSGTDHLIVRLKINGHGPYNFVVDTGAPTLFLDEGVAREIGLTPDPAARPAGGRRSKARPTTGPAARPPGQGWTFIDRLDIEGGLSIDHVPCIIQTPYQITGMNSTGLPGMTLHGLLGYSVLARFKMDIDLSRHRMLWTPQPPGYVPPPLQPSGEGRGDAREEQLESMGGVLRVLGPLVKMSMPGPARPRGWVGVELADGPGGTVSAGRVMAGGPADRAGIHTGEILVSVNGHHVASVADVLALTSHLLPGQQVRLGVSRSAKPTVKTTTEVVGNTMTTTTVITTTVTELTMTCEEGL
jgi:hypothetical protein